MNIYYPERKRIRLSEYDYSSDGDYFVTICTKYRQDFFGEIHNGIMGLNEFGCIVAKCWQEIPKYFNYVQLDDWQIMPNHFHGVINIEIPVIRNTVGDAFLRPDEMRNVVSPNSPNTPISVMPSRDADDGTRCVGMSGLQKSVIPSRDARMRPLRGADRTKMILPKIIHGFKSAVTREINRIQNTIFFQWQRSYYDHIIRDEKSLNNICGYIQNNPYKWSLDFENRKNQYRANEINNHYDSLFNKYSV